MKHVKLLAVAIYISSSVISWAHGDHDWIRQHNKQSDLGGSCCGLDDCFVAEYVIKKDGVLFKNVKIRKNLPDVRDIFVPNSRIQPSLDGRPWICINQYYSNELPKDDQRVDRCAFLGLNS